MIRKSGSLEELRVETIATGGGCIIFRMTFQQAFLQFTYHTYEYDSLTEEICGLCA
jgi:hypothetical protein